MLKILFKCRCKHIAISRQDVAMSGTMDRVTEIANEATNALRKQPLGR